MNKSDPMTEARIRKEQRMTMTDAEELICISDYLISDWNYVSQKSSDSLKNALEKHTALISIYTCALLDEPSLSDCITMLCIFEGEHYTNDFHQNCALFLLKCFPNEKAFKSVFSFNY